MKKKIEKIIQEDYNNNYNFKPDKEKIYNELGIDRNKSKGVMYWKRLCNSLAIVIIILICGIGGVVGLVIKDRHQGVNEYTKEFKDYTKSLKCDSLNLYCNLIVNGHDDFLIYSGKTEKNQHYYFYYFTTQKDNNNVILLNDSQEIKLDNECYGILAIKEENDSKALKFSLSINGEIKEFILN